MHRTGLPLRQRSGARAEKIDALSISRILNWETKGVELICLCYVEYATPAQIRYAIRRFVAGYPRFRFSSLCWEMLNALRMMKRSRTRNSCNNLYARPSIKSWLLP